MPPRFFTYERATALLPEVRRLITDALDARSAQKRSENDLRAYKKRLVMAGGAFPNRNRMNAYEDNAKTSHASMKSAIGRIAELGVEVKDLEKGLVDFPTLYQGREVYLCYRLGEDRIEHWHGLTEGFQGRKPIDDHFLGNHEGDPVV